MSTLRYRLFGIGKLPGELRAAVEQEGILHLDEGVPVAFRFTGTLPGLTVAGTNTRTYSGALALTHRRILGTLSVLPRVAGRAIDHEWTEQSPGPLAVTIDEAGVHLQVDLAEVDPGWKGRLELHYKLTFSSKQLGDLPSRSFTLSVPREWVLRLAGVPTNLGKAGSA